MKANLYWGSACAVGVFVHSLHFACVQKRSFGYISAVFVELAGGGSAPCCNDVDNCSNIVLYDVI